MNHHNHHAVGCKEAISVRKSAARFLVLSLHRHDSNPVTDHHLRCFDLSLSRAGNHSFPFLLLTQEVSIMSSSLCSHGSPRSLSRLQKQRYENAIQNFLEILSDFKADDDSHQFQDKVLNFLKERQYLVQKEFLGYLVSKGVTATAYFCRTKDFIERGGMEISLNVVTQRDESRLTYLITVVEILLNLSLIHI